MSKKPLVSIIVPAHNAENLISETIESVLQQTYQNWEMVITDDGSTDNTIKVIEGYAEKDQRIKLIRFEKNTGLAAKVRNASMKKAKGEYFAFLDADDLFHPRKLEKQILYFQENPEVDALCTWYHIVGESERAKKFKKMLWRFSETKVTIDQILSQAMQTSTVIMKRKCFEETGGMDERESLVSGQDYEFFVRIVARYNAHRIPEDLMGYRVADIGESLSSSRFQNEKRRKRELSILEALKDKKILEEKHLKKREAIMYYNLAKDNLFTYNQPFRKDLLRSVITFKAPLKAWILFLLSPLPSGAIKYILILLLRIRNPE